MEKLNLARMACIVFVFCAATAIALSAQTFTTLVNFNGTNGAGPYYVSLIQANGNLYGTTSGGGLYDQGTVFKATAAGALMTLSTFCSKTNCTDGAQPFATLVLGTNGNLYGTTSSGGAHVKGTVFTFDPSTKTLTTLHSFAGAPTDGANPFAGLVETGGNFYGTTAAGGTPHGLGTVFKITSSGTLTTLHSFDNTDGAQPYAGLIQASDGNLYGTTSGGGAHGLGTVFKITSGGTLTTLHSFDNTDGAQPYAGLIQASDGNLYGTTVTGGANFGGTVFKITLVGQLTVLYSFCAKNPPYCTDGALPYAGLIQGSDGNFYGTTNSGGAKNWGTVFKITSGGKLTILHSFVVTDGAAPYGGLLQATNGLLYGTTFFGGSRYDGTVFSVSP